mgnify:CR=1 FL=1
MKRLLVLVAVLGLLVSLSVAVAILLRPDLPDAPKASDERPPAGLEKFYTQDVSWERCGQNTCAMVEVPVDYSKPDGETLELKVLRVASAGKTGRVLFVNPGGPGGSGADFARTVAGSLATEMKNTFDVVGVDPRGVGASTPLECLSDEKFDKFIAIDPTPDNAKEIAAGDAAIRQMGEACLKNSGTLAKNVETHNAARDQDVVRALLGQKKLDWYGASYGTQLGATYADLFPAKVGRMVLDGAVDLSLDNVGSSKGQAEGFHRALVAYLENCVEDGDCPLGDSVDEGIATLNAFLNSLDQKPLGVPGSRLLTESHGFFGVAVALYSQDSWPMLTMALEDALSGKANSLMYLADAYFERQADGSFTSNSGQVISAINCLDSPGGSSTEEVKALIPEFTEVSPVFGKFLAWGTAACAAWPLESANPQQVAKATGAPPIVVVGTTRDPATPYEWAQALASQLESGVLLSREGDGHTAYLLGNECIQAAIDNFYLNGDVPAGGTVCKE